MDHKNFITFPTAYTNIFPAANGTNGSQLMTEWNIRSRETVGTYSAIPFEVGPSFVHSEKDFEVRVSEGTSSTLEICEGRGVINGHFVQTLAPMTIDLLKANAELKADQYSGGFILKGYLEVGIRAMYATEETVAGTLAVENSDNMYLGMQMVVAPKLVTPEEAETESDVTAHLRLASFTFTNNKISGITNFSQEKLRYISADRLANIDSMLSDSYVTKTGLNTSKIYAFAGKGTIEEGGVTKDTWQDATQSLMIWDVQRSPVSDAPLYKNSEFIADTDSAYLVLARMQPQGMTDQDGNPMYYPNVLKKLPTADFASNSVGVVNKDYTRAIKEVAEKVERFRSQINGKQILYMDTKDDSTVLPPITSNYAIGDYILVGTDYSAYGKSLAVASPSTMYVVLPGKVLNIVYAGNGTEDSSQIPSSLKLTGSEIGSLIKTSQPDSEGKISGSYPTFYSADDEVRGRDGSARDGSKVDYFRYRYVYSLSGSDHFIDYYYKVASSGDHEWSSCFKVTGEIPLATEEAIGGFYNVSLDNADSGYVYLDDTGRLRLVDYALLRSGTLAYQLAEDLVLSPGLDSIAIQEFLNEYVNERIAFPSDKQKATSSPNMIHVYIPLSKEASGTINIGNIDSRFSTGVCLHFTGNADSNTVINIYDCERLKIDNDIEGTPVINVYRSCLYYDPFVLNYIRSCTRSNDFTGFEDMSLWYQKQDDDDPDIVVDHMTVSEINAPIVPEQMEYWKDSASYDNDNYYLTALKSISFAGNGDIVGCGLLVANNSTDNIDQGTKIVAADFELPQGSGLAYPKACMTKQLKVSGSFVSGYRSTDPDMGDVWIITDNMFSAITQAYDKYDQSPSVKGNIAFHSTTSLVKSSMSQKSIPVWETQSYHLFYGGSMS